MNYLALDTSTDRASVGLFFQGTFYLEHQDNIRTHALQLLPMIDAILKKSGCSFGQLDGLIVGRGPGSFTGLRIAISHAKGLAFAHDLPIYQVSTLKAIAYGAREELKDMNTIILSVLDARMNQLYWSVYSQISEDSLEQVSDPQQIDVFGQEPIILAGVGFNDYISKLPTNIQSRIIDTIEIYPCVRSMVSLVSDGGYQACTADEVLPVYLRNNVAHSK